MIKNITIRNFKSIDKIEFSLGRVNVFIGENGAGKSNILEAIALAGATSARKLDNEFLSSRGIRVTQPSNMRQAFDEKSFSDEISVGFSNDSGESKEWVLSNDNQPYSKWQSKLVGEAKENEVETQNKIISAIERLLEQLNNLSELEKRVRVLKKGKDPQRLIEINEVAEDIVNTRKSTEEYLSFLTKNTKILELLGTFLIYSPENSSLKTFEKESQVEPLGINGEGLMKLISVVSTDIDQTVLNDIKSSMKILGWFEDFEVVEDGNNPSRLIAVKDRYIGKNSRVFDQLSTNEGFLFLLFYFALFTSKLTPRFFAIDNIDASLNPKLCEQLIKILIRMANQYDKQVILTTHNPAILDGLNLDDDNQCLFVISRGRNGATKIKRILKPKSEEGRSVRLSEMFIKGILGGLPHSF